MTYRMLACCTSHLRPETIKRLEDGDFEWLVGYRMEYPGDTETVYGVFVPALDLNISDCSPEIMDIPEDLLMLLQYADKVGYDWIMLDADEEEIPELQTYLDEWKATEV